MLHLILRVQVDAIKLHQEAVQQLAAATEDNLKLKQASCMLRAEL
jgi:hypothetical protein